MKSNVLEFWQAIEALTPQDALSVNPSDLMFPVYGIRGDGHAVMPWADSIHLRKPLEAGMGWVYDAQCGIYQTDLLTACVLRVLSREDESDEEPEKRTSTSRLFDLRFDEAGCPIPQTLSLSLSAWASGYLLRDGATIASLLAGGSADLVGLPEPSSVVSNPQSGFAGFDELNMALVQWVSDHVDGAPQGDFQADTAWLSELSNLVRTKMGLPMSILGDNPTLVRVRAMRVKKDNAQDRSETSEGLSSFYAADLRKIAVAVQKGDFGQGFAQFMLGATPARVAQRVDVRDSASFEVLREILSPKNMPKGRWPSDHALAFSQQVAVNSAFLDFAANAGLFSVNGPPGTGKTTLLRDVVAEVVTERAAKLVKLGSNAFGAKGRTKVGDANASFYPLDKSLQGFSIVVATNGNGAAENVTLELPAVGSVPARVAQSSNYFPELASVVTQKSAWGLIAARLGKRSHRTDFVQRFWWGAKSKAQPQAEEQTMRKHLSDIIDGRKQPVVPWTKAVERFNKAVRAETQCRKEVAGISKLPASISGLITDSERARAQLEGIKREQLERNELLDHAGARLSELNDVLMRAKAEATAALREVQKHEACKPGVLQFLASMGKANKLWQAKASELVDKHESAALWAQQVSVDTDAVDTKIIDLKMAKVRANTAESAAFSDLAHLLHARKDAEEKLSEAMQEFGTSWVDVELEQEHRERITPWGVDRWLAAREEVFLAALEVHRAFLEAHPDQMAANLRLSCDWLSGKRVDASLTQLALDTLCLVVPVISATFASFPRMFAKAGSQSIGYLLVDEGGQAQSPHVACAVWRAKRTLIVGDPLQLEPVVTIAPGLESELARHFSVATDWMPSWSSAQGLADASARLGTSLSTIPGEELWIGCPLRLHRRCAPEMFHISNQIAYAGMMVYGKSVVDQHDWPQTAWLDVPSTTSEGHWIEGEGARLHELLSTLLAMGMRRDEIAMISPFRDCASRLTRIAKAFELDEKKVGTVHTAQGKEADIVVVVLGGNPKSSGAKAWAASKPNLLNVAVSRGKKRLYVIGDRKLWKKHSYFSVMAEQLPVQAHSMG